MLGYASDGRSVRVVDDVSAYDIGNDWDSSEAMMLTHLAVTCQSMDTILVRVGWYNLINGSLVTSELAYPVCSPSDPIVITGIAPTLLVDTSS